MGNETAEESVSDVLAGASAFAPEKAAEKPATDDKASDKETAAPSAAKDTKPDGEKPKDEGQTRDEQGRFKKPEDEPKEETPKDRPKVDVAAIIDERRKRQAAEARLAQLEGQKSGEKPSVFDDEDAAINTRVDAGTRDIRTKFWKQSVKLARLTHKDEYDQAESAFAAAAEADERLWDALRDSDDPGEFIFTMGIQIAELADVGGDLTKYREKVTGQLRTQLSEKDARITALEQEVETLKKAQADLANLPRSLNRHTSGPAPKAGDEGDDDIKDIVRFGNQSR